MRWTPLIALLATASLATAAPAAAKQSISVSPNPVSFGQTLTIRGKGWPVIEFCSRAVRLSLRSDQNAFRIGKVRTRTNGRFKFEFVPRRSKVGAGRWRVVARMRCESGENGSTIFTRASAPVRIR